MIVDPELFGYIRREKDRTGQMPKLIFRGTGEVRTSAMGRYLARVLAIGEVPAERRAGTKKRVQQLLWLHLQGEFGPEQRRAYVHALCEELRIDQRDERKRQLVEATLTICRFFEDYAREHNQRPCEIDLGRADRAAPRDFLAGAPASAAQERTGSGD